MLINNCKMFIWCPSVSIQLCFLLVNICIGYINADVLVFSNKDSHHVEQGFRDLPAKFGGMIPAEGFKGLLVRAEPATACQDIKGPPNSPEYEGNNWIVLIARLNCSFEVKIRNAQKAGYDAAIVHNVRSNDLEPMSAKDAANITIPSVFVGEFSGSFLNETYLYDQEYFILITDIPLNFNTNLLLPFAIVVGICFLVMVIFMIVRCIKDRRRQRRHRLPNSSLKKIPTHKYTKGDPYETCAICLDDYIENEKLRVLPCAHAYHTKCIDPWLTKNRRVCPVCKRKVFAADEHVEPDSDSDSDADDSTPLIRNGVRSGTQGGTFESDVSTWRHWLVRDVLETRAARVRRPSQNSDSSYDSARMGPNGSGEARAAGTVVGIETEDADSTNNSEAAAQTVFLASDCHSINGEVPDFERSVSSTKPHTVNLSSEGDENCTVEVNAHTVERPQRHFSTAGAINQLPTSVIPQISDDNDIII